MLRSSADKSDKIGRPWWQIDHGLPWLAKTESSSGSPKDGVSLFTVVAAVVCVFRMRISNT